jgi:hypothetical protein
MGVMARKFGENFIIISDRVAGDLPSKHAPKKQINDVFQVWTGNVWATSSSETVVSFATLEMADDYIRANMDRLLL